MLKQILLLSIHPYHWIKHFEEYCHLPWWLWMKQRWFVVKGGQEGTRGALRLSFGLWPYQDSWSPDSPSIWRTYRLLLANFFFFCISLYLADHVLLILLTKRRFCSHLIACQFQKSVSIHSNSRNIFSKALTRKVLHSGHQTLGADSQHQ